MKKVTSLAIWYFRILTGFRLSYDDNNKIEFPSLDDRIHFDKEAIRMIIALLGYLLINIIILTPSLLGVFVFSDQGLAYTYTIFYVIIMILFTVIELLLNNNFFKSMLILVIHIFAFFHLFNKKRARIEIFQEIYKSGLFFLLAIMRISIKFGLFYILFNSIIRQFG